MPKLSQLGEEMSAHANAEKALILERFFKTGKGEYGEGDKFIGLTVPQIRSLANKYIQLSIKDIKILLCSAIHEERLLALLILVLQFQKGDDKIRPKIYNFYIRNTDHINNWDLVDLSSDKIVGSYLFDRPKTLLYQLAVSANLWERRIAIVSTFNFIKQHRYGDTLKLAEILLNDPHDLIHKAVGWMLREVGKKDQNTLEKFLNKNFQKMPRTMLRYSLERFSEQKRKFYLKK